MSHFTDPQTAAIKAAILADPVLAAKTSGPGTDFVGIAAAMSLPAAPDFFVYRQAVNPDAWRFAIVSGAIQLDNLTAGKRDALLYVCAGTIDCRVAANRQTLDDLTGSQNTLKAALVAAETKKATRVEKAISTLAAGGNGAAGTLAAPAAIGAGSEGELGDGIGLSPDHVSAMFPPA